MGRGVSFIAADLYSCRLLFLVLFISPKNAAAVPRVIPELATSV